MDHDTGARSARFGAYMAQIAEVLDHDRRTGPLTSYCTGLLSRCERKSVEPMAAMTAPRETAAQHQRMLHFVGQGLKLCRCFQHGHHLHHRSLRISIKKACAAT